MRVLKQEKYSIFSILISRSNELSMKNIFSHDDVVSGSY